MTAHRHSPPLLIRPRASRRLAGFVILTHVSAAAVLPTLSPGWLVGLLLTLVGLSFVEILMTHVLRRAPWSIRSAVWNPDGTWAIQLVSGVEQEVRLAPATFISPSLVVLRFQAGRLRRRTLPLFADALDGEQHRGLRQRLRIEGGAHLDP
jgi:toxin CptA